MSSDLADVHAAVQAAAHIENWDLAREIAEEHGLIDICLICVKAPVEVRLMRRGVERGYPFCMPCNDAWIEATPDFDPDFDTLPKKRR